MKTEELKIRVKELNDYFISQIIEGNYQIIKKDSIYIIIKISDYSFTFWFGMDVNSFKIMEMDFDEPNFMKLHFDDRDVKKTVRSILMSDVTDTRDEEIRRLEQKLAALKSIRV